MDPAEESLVGMIVALAARALRVLKIDLTAEQVTQLKDITVGLIAVVQFASVIIIARNRAQASKIPHA